MSAVIFQNHYSNFILFQNRYSEQVFPVIFILVFKLIAVFTVFVPDASKDGGSYAEVTDRVKRIDEAAGEVVLMSKRARSGVRESIPLARIVDVRGEAVDGIAAE